jgi:hypothetical protein
MNIKRTKVPELPGPLVGRRRVAVDHGGHQLTGDDMQKGPHALTTYSFQSFWGAVADCQRRSR